jgi:hypothetical protein
MCNMHETGNNGTMLLSTPASIKPVEQGSNVRKQITFCLGQWPCSSERMQKDLGRLAH